MPISTHTPYEKPELQVVGDRIRPLVRAGTHELFEVRGPEGSGPPPHAHAWNESYVVLDGEIVVIADGREDRVGPGTVVHIPAGVTHCYRIATAEARFLVTTSGDKASAFFEDMDAHVPPGAPTPESLPALVEVARRNGLTSPLF